MLPENVTKPLVEKWNNGLKGVNENIISHNKKLCLSFLVTMEILPKMPLVEGDHDRRIRLNFVNALEERFRRKPLTFLSIESGQIFCRFDQAKKSLFLRLIVLDSVLPSWRFKLSWNCISANIAESSSHEAARPYLKLTQIKQIFFYKKFLLILADLGK